jgi:hypothetical protein
VTGGEPLGNASDCDERGASEEYKRATGTASDCDEQLRATATSEERARSTSEQQAPRSEGHKRATGTASDCDEQQAPTSEGHKRATGTAAQEAARLIEAIGEWLAVRAGGTSGGSSGGTWAQWGSEHIATGAPECQICPLCRLIAAARTVGPEVAGHVDDAMQAFAAALRLAADAMGNRGGDAAGPDNGFQTIVIN